MAYSRSCTPPRRNSLGLAELNTVTYANIFLGTPPTVTTVSSYTFTPMKNFEEMLKGAEGQLEPVDGTQTMVDYMNSLPLPFTPLRDITALPTGPRTPMIQLGTNFASFASPIEEKHQESKQDPPVSNRITFAPLDGTCHACKKRQWVYPCYNLHPPVERNRCDLSYCDSCIAEMVDATRHVLLPAIETVGGWNQYIKKRNTAMFCCPRCHGFCNCTACMDKKEKPEPSGIRRRANRARRRKPAPYVVDAKRYTKQELLDMVGEPKPMSLEQATKRRAQRRAPVKIREIREPEYPNFKRSVSQDMEHHGKCLADDIGPLRCIREFNYCTLYNPASDQCGEYDKYEIDN